MVSNADTPIKFNMLLPKIAEDTKHKWLLYLVTLDTIVFIYILYQLLSGVAILGRLHELSSTYLTLIFSLNIVILTYFTSLYKRAIYPLLLLSLQTVYLYYPLSYLFLSSRLDPEIWAILIKENIPFAAIAFLNIVAIWICARKAKKSINNFGDEKIISTVTNNERFILLGAITLSGSLFVIELGLVIYPAAVFSVGAMLKLGAAQMIGSMTISALVYLLTRIFAELPFVILSGVTAASIIIYLKTYQTSKNVKIAGYTFVCILCAQYLIVLALSMIGGVTAAIS